MNKEKYEIWNAAIAPHSYCMNCGQFNQQSLRYEVCRKSMRPFADIWIQPLWRDSRQVAPDWKGGLPLWLANSQYTQSGAQRSGPCSEERSGVPIPEGHGEEEGGTVTGWSKKKKEEWGSPCAVKVQKELLCAAAFTFFSVISLSLPPNLSLPHSAEVSASSKDTLVDSRKSGCCRSDKNLVGVSMWVEPVEEQRWLHHSSLSTCLAPSPTLSRNKRVKKDKQPVVQCTHTHTHTHTHRDTLIHWHYTLTMLHKHIEVGRTQKKDRKRHGVAAIQRQQLF